MVTDKDTIDGISRYGRVPVALATMGYKHRAPPHDKIHASVSAPNYLLIPHVDRSVRTCELVRYRCEDVTVKGASEGRAALELLNHALAPVWHRCRCARRSPACTSFATTPLAWAAGFTTI